MCDDDVADANIVIVVGVYGVVVVIGVVAVGGVYVVVLVGGVVIGRIDFANGVVVFSIVGCDTRVGT